jgi:phosphotransferase system  glucose/maltose/N-acetylglucosamine-specific IIC component
MARLFFHALLFLVCGSAGFSWTLFVQTPLIDPILGPLGIDPKIIGFAAAAICFMILEFPIHKMTVNAVLKKAASSTANNGQ